MYQQWQSIENPKKKERFYNEHYGEITLYQTAKNFFNNRLNGANITPKAWKSELEELKKSSATDRAKISKFEDEIAILETIAVNVERLENYEEKAQQRDMQRGKVTSWSKDFGMFLLTILHFKVYNSGMEICHIGLRKE